MSANTQIGHAAALTSCDIDGMPLIAILAKTTSAALQHLRLMELPQKIPSKIAEPGRPDLDAGISFAFEEVHVSKAPPSSGLQAHHLMQIQPLTLMLLLRCPPETPEFHHAVADLQIFPPVLGTF